MSRWDARSVRQGSTATTESCPLTASNPQSGAPKVHRGQRSFQKGGFVECMAMPFTPMANRSRSAILDSFATTAYALHVMDMSPYGMLRTQVWQNACSLRRVLIAPQLMWLSHARLVRSVTKEFHSIVNQGGLHQFMGVQCAVYAITGGTQRLPIARRAWTVQRNITVQ